MAVLPHRKKRPQQAPIILLRAMLVFTLCPHLHRSAHLLCQGARLNPKGTVTSLSLTHVSLISSETSVSSSWNGKGRKNKRIIATDLSENKVSSYQSYLLAFQTWAMKTESDATIATFNSCHSWLKGIFSKARLHFTLSNIVSLWTRDAAYWWRLCLSSISKASSSIPSTGKNKTLSI